MLNRVVTGVFFLACAACAAPQAGSQFTAAGYSNSTYTYTVGYAQGALVLPQGWVLDNYVTTPRGLVPREDTGYVTALHLDRDGDRAPEAAIDVPAYDLRFIHGAHPGLVWLRTFPYSYHLHDRPLAELARDYVTYMAAAGLEQAVIDDRPPGPPQVSVTVRGQATWMVAGHPAEVLALEEAPATGGAVRKAYVVIARPGFMYQQPAKRGASVLYPVLMVVGYSNAPERFAAGMPDFEGMLRQISIAGVSGLTKLAEPEPPAAPVPAAADPPPAPPADAAPPAEDAAPGAPVPETSALPPPAGPPPSAAGAPPAPVPGGASTGALPPLPK